MKEVYDDSELIADASKIVNTLLESETIRQCVVCAREHHLTDPNVTHGLCKRHTIDWGRQAGMTPEQIEEIVTSTEAGNGFPPDLGPAHKPVHSPHEQATHFKSKYPTLHRFLHQHHHHTHNK